jgi:hypothetical protein
LRCSKPQLPHGKDIAVDSASNFPSSDGISLVSALDTRAIPLEQLAKDDAVRRRITAIVESTEEEARVRVARFGSAI